MKDKRKKKKPKMVFPVIYGQVYPMKLENYKKAFGINQPKKK